ncbi:MAG: methylmalonyl Co-A mutase-associated GTPase MeaB [Thermodesulfobacteriota bacterium]
MTQIETILKGDVLSAARLMRDIDDDVPSARRMLKDLYPFTGRAHILGITGSPGTGKSTLVDQLIEAVRKEGRTVGIVAVDPTSPFSGGAILGDRVRMQRHSTDQGVFIRSVATRGHLGGLSRSTHDLVDVLDAMGKDLIIVETVGVGQDEVEIVRLAHTTLVVQVPGLGDSIQALKAGLLETGDIFVVNKADLDGADKTVLDLEMMLEIKACPPGSWRPPIVKTVASEALGLSELLTAIERHREYLKERPRNGSGDWRIQGRFVDILRDTLLAAAVEKTQRNGKWPGLMEALKTRRIDPYSAAEEVLDDLFDNS